MTTETETKIRSFGVKLKLAQEFAWHSGTPKAFRALFAERDKSDGQYHRAYSAEAIRYARLKQLNLEKDPPKRPRSLPPIINCRMAKGGTGKTTVAANVATALAMFGHKVLMIDGDPQSSLTGLFGINWATENITHIGELMHRSNSKKPTRIKDAVRNLYEDGMLDLIASDITLADADSWLMGVMSRESVFKRLLESDVDFFSQYDVIMIDSAPGTNLLTNNFMFACDKILAVVWLDGQSLKAMEVLASNVSELNTAFKDHGFHLDVHIVANGFDKRYKTCTEALETLASTYPNLLDDNVLPHYAGFMRQSDLFSEEKSGPVLEREPNSVGARAIIDLAKSLIKYYDIRLAGIAETMNLKSRGRA